MNTANVPATISIGSTLIHQHDGLYSLNDLHKASGGEAKHRPFDFLRLDQTKSLIDEISKSGDSRFYLQTTRGRYASTYACRELVIAYASWISAEFHLKVIRVFLDHVDTARAALPPPPPVPTRTVRFEVPLSASTTRWLLHTDRTGRETVTPLSADTHIATPAELVNALMKSPGDLNISLEQQLTIIAACLRNVQTSTTSSARRRGITPAVPAHHRQGEFASFGAPPASTTPGA